MRKPIFESEEEAREYHKEIEEYCEDRECIPSDDCADCAGCNSDSAKRLGFIKQSPVEKAEEIYRIYKLQVEEFGVDNLSMGDENVDKLYEAIIDLKKQVKELTE